MNSLVTRSHLFNDIFRDIAPGFFIKPLHGDALPEPSQIRIDVKETDTLYTVHADVPGVSKEDLQVTLDGNIVTLRAEMKQCDTSKKDERELRCERYFGEISRSFQLPMEIDKKEAHAKYENGVLTLTLPKKRAESSVQRLKIS